MKRAFALLPFALFSLALVGCGSSSDDATSVKEMPVNAPVSPEQQAAARAQIANDPKSELNAAESGVPH